MGFNLQRLQIFRQFEWICEFANVRIRQFTSSQLLKFANLQIGNYSHTQKLTVMTEIDEDFIELFEPFRTLRERHAVTSHRVYLKHWRINIRMNQFENYFIPYT